MFHLVDMTIQNAYNLFLLKTGNRIPLRKFCNGLVHQMLAKYGTPTSVLHGCALSQLDLPDRLLQRVYTARHHPIIIPPPAVQDGETRTGLRVHRGSAKCVPIQSFAQESEN